MEEKTIEIDESVTKAITDSVMAGLQPQLEELKKQAQPQDKEVSKLAGGDSQAVEGEVVSKYSKMSKETFAVAQLHAALSGNQKELGELNTHALKTLQDKGMVTKATYLNAGTDADGAVLVPNADLLTDVLNILPQYSALANELRVVNLTTGSSIDVSSLTADVVMTEVGTEGGSKAVTKPTLGDTNVPVREFAGIALMTKKLVQQSAIDVYAVLRDSFARAIAKKREQLILTDSTSGIVNKAGVVANTLATGNTLVANVDYADIMGLPYRVPTSSAAGGIYVVSRTLLASLAGRVDANGQPIVMLDAASAGSLTGRFSNGYRFVVSEVLGATDAASTTHAVFGNFAQYGVVVRQGAIDSAVFDSGTVVDGGSVSHNLIQENKLAMRVETWENVGYPLPGAFVLLTTSAT